MFLAAIILWPIIWIKGIKFPEIQPSLLWLSFLSGFFLSLHFAFWVEAFSYTSVASAVVFVSTQPFFVAVMGILFFKEKISLTFTLGLFLAIGGGLFIGWGDLTLGEPEALKGNFLALLGAFFAACYFMVGGRIRDKLDLLPYITLSYSTAALFLLIFCLVLKVPLGGYTTFTYVQFFLLALIPTLIGHTSLNWSLKYLPTSFVTLTVLGEPVVATLLAFMLLGEIPHVPTLLGGALILGGIFIAMRGLRMEMTEEKMTGKF